jgi:hypothetical protein
MTYTEVRSRTVHAAPESVFTPIRRIGGEAGWYYANWLWRIRGALDRMVGGVGMRGRCDPERLAVGDVLDCWRVEAFEPDRRLRLSLELRQPGRGWLEFVVVPNGAGTKLLLTASYEPGGWPGRLYWRCTSLAHDLLFGGMLREICARSVRSQP